MQNITNQKSLKDGNQILGVQPEIMDSQIIFQGKNNILYCEEGVSLERSVIKFRGDNSVIYLGRGIVSYEECVFDVYSDSAIAIGPDCGISHRGVFEIIASEHRHCVIGAEALISRDVMIRTSDAHMIFSSKTGERIAKGKSVFIGDHVWLGQDVTIMKGTAIDSGSIIGSGACVAGKKIPHNTSWAGNPARMLGSDLFWNPSHAAELTQEDKISSNYDLFSGSGADSACRLYPPGRHARDAFIYSYAKEEEILYEDLDEALSNAAGAAERLQILKELYQDTSKNRFVHELS